MFLQQLISSIFIIIGVLFIIIASIGILKLPDFYIRMSAITKAGTMGVGFIAIGIAIYFNELGISTKAFVIISFMIFTAPVAAHVIARAAYKQRIPFWGKNLVDELDGFVKKREELESIVANAPENVDAKIELIKYHTALPPLQGGSFRKAVIIASELKEIDLAEGHRALGMLYAKDNDFKLAEDEYKSAVKASVSKIKYQYELGKFYREAKWYKKAFNAFKKIQDDNPNEHEALIEIGKTTALTRTLFKEGIEALTELINKQPQPNSSSLAKAHTLLAIIHRKNKENLKAKENTEKALKYNSSEQLKPL